MALRVLATRFCYAVCAQFATVSAALPHTHVLSVAAHYVMIYDIIADPTVLLA